MRPASAAARCGAGLHFGIIVSEFNNFVTDRLLAGALEAFASAGARKQQLEVVRVPGSFELPIAAKKLAATRRFDSLDLHWLRAARRDLALRLRVFGNRARHSARATRYRRADRFLRADMRHARNKPLLAPATRTTNKGYESAIGAIEMAQLSRNYSNKIDRAETCDSPRRTPRETPTMSLRQQVARIRPADAFRMGHDAAGPRPRREAFLEVSARLRANAKIRGSNFSRAPSPRQAQSM